MIEILAAPAHVGAYRFSGTLTVEDYDLCTADIEARLALHRRVGIYADLRNLDGIGPAALARDLRYTLGKIGEFDRFARGAIVTGRPWLAAVTDLAARFFPQTELRSFDEDAADAAMDWVTSFDPHEPGPESR